MDQRSVPLNGLRTPRRPTRRISARVAIAVAITAAGVGGCGSSDEHSPDGFRRVVGESRIGTDSGQSVARAYADCLYRETAGQVADLVEHLDDTSYQPSGATAEAVATCSDVLVAAG